MKQHNLLQNVEYSLVKCAKVSLDKNMPGSVNFRIQIKKQLLINFDIKTIGFFTDMEFYLVGPGTRI